MNTAEWAPVRTVLNVHVHVHVHVAFKLSLLWNSLGPTQTVSGFGRFWQQKGIASGPVQLVTAAAPSDGNVAKDLTSGGRPFSATPFFPPTTAAESALPLRQTVTHL